MDYTAQGRQRGKLFSPIFLFTVFGYVYAWLAAFLVLRVRFLSVFPPFFAVLGRMRERRLSDGGSIVNINGMPYYYRGNTAGREEEGHFS